ncbi:MAG: DUF2461 domain-containing protein [Bryobacterales bacterium]|nr:DUF2461 domain-containing protein [Bryobacterales bacterium]MBV9397515.1 DUF2461 domain-containing protein [Bryobacterales bacterium]
MFAGFPPEALKFLRGLERNNRREWFQPRKEIFETSVKAPMLELVEAVNAELLRFAPDHITDPKKAVYRIYRDTRFSPDKTPYKTHVAAIFPRRDKERHTSAGFYFHIAPKSVAIAMGAYMPGPVELFAVRTWLAAHHQEFREAMKSVEKLMGELRGDSLARSPKGFDPAHPASDLIRRKAWYFGAELEPEITESPKLLPEIVKRFRAGAPVIEMLNAGLVRKAAEA